LEKIMVHALLISDFEKNAADSTPVEAAKASAWAKQMPAEARGFYSDKLSSLRTAAGRLRDRSRPMFGRPDKKAEAAEKAAHAAISDILAFAQRAGWPAGWAHPRVAFAADSDRESQWHPLELSKMCAWAAEHAWSGKAGGLKKWGLAIHALSTGLLGDESLAHYIVRQEPGSKAEQGQDRAALTQTATLIFTAWENAGGSLETQEKERKWRPLHMAFCDEGVEPFEASARALIGLKVKMDAKDSEGDTVMRLAARAHASEALLMDLLAAGAPLFVDRKKNPLSGLEAIVDGHGEGFALKMIQASLEKHTNAVNQKFVKALRDEFSGSALGEKTEEIAASAEARALREALEEEQRRAPADAKSVEARRRALRV